MRKLAFAVILTVAPVSLSLAGQEADEMEEAFSLVIEEAKAEKAENKNAFEDSLKEAHDFGLPKDKPWRSWLTQCTTAVILVDDNEEAAEFFSVAYASLAALENPSISAQKLSSSFLEDLDKTTENDVTDELVDDCRSFIDQAL